MWKAQRLERLIIPTLGGPGWFISTSKAVVNSRVGSPIMVMKEQAMQRRYFYVSFILCLCSEMSIFTHRAVQNIQNGIFFSGTKKHSTVFYGVGMVVLY